MSRVDIVGAGPAGLMAAWRTSAAGHECVVYEAGSAVGGMARSFEVAGQRVDLGSHRLHPATPPDLLVALRSLLGDELQVRRRKGRIRLGGRWVAFPLRGTDLARKLPLPISAGITADTLRRPLRQEGDTSFADVVRARLGPTVLDAFYGPYARKLYGLAPDQLAAEQARRRIAVRSPGDVLRRLLPRRNNDAATFLYPRNGYGSIVERLAEAAAEAGAELRLDSPVNQIRTDRTTLFTASPAALAAVIDPPPAASVDAALRTQRLRSMVLVYLVVATDRYTPFDAHYLPGLGTPVSRLSEPKNYRDGPDPSGQTVLCAEIPCWRGDEIWESSAAAIGERVVADLESLGLPEIRLLDVRTERLASVYPVYDLAGAEDRALVQDWLRSLDAVLVLGRQGLGVADNLHHVLVMGAAAAACIEPDGSLDRAGWLAALDRFDDHIVED